MRDDCETKQHVCSLFVFWGGGGLVNSMRDFSDGSYLVDPASSHMLVSKIKPCMSMFKQSKRETAHGSL